VLHNPRVRIWQKLRITLEMIKFEHTIFALPFAFIGALMAGNGLPTGRQIAWIVAAMVGARSAAMTFNRIVDYRYDRLNPRTDKRALPAGTLSIPFAMTFTILMSGAVHPFSSPVESHLFLFVIPNAGDSLLLFVHKAIHCAQPSVSGPRDRAGSACCMARGARGICLASGLAERSRDVLDCRV
jgi:hypothetical protein